jgi:DNA replication protein DnaC
LLIAINSQIRLGTPPASSKARSPETLRRDFYRASPGLDRPLMRSLAKDSGWVGRHENVFVIGPRGASKSFLPRALARKACRDGNLFLYTALLRCSAI